MHVPHPVLELSSILIGRRPHGIAVLDLSLWILFQTEPSFGPQVTHPSSIIVDLRIISDKKLAAGRVDNQWACLAAFQRLGALNP